MGSQQLPCTGFIAYTALGDTDLPLAVLSDICNIVGILIVYLISW